ncbi:MAG: RES domain-containing protein [Bryobacteraceae bacterium]
MRVWRICPKAYAPSAFDGEGARRTGGRWNRVGLRMIYTAESLALAALEYFVHLSADYPELKLAVIPAEVPPEVIIKQLRAADLPANWREYPAPASLRGIGARWLDSGETAVLAAPSALIPQERIYLLNPAHPHFTRIAIGKPEAFAFDPRMRTSR